MIKYLMILIAGLVLSGGTLLNAEPINKAVDSACNVADKPSWCNTQEDIGLDKGYPFSYVTDIDESEVKSKFSDFSTDRLSTTAGIDASSFVVNWGFWSVAACIGYLVFKKLRDIAGTIAIAGVGIIAALAYFGALAL